MIRNSQQPSVLVGTTQQSLVAQCVTSWYPSMHPHVSMELQGRLELMLFVSLAWFLVICVLRAKSAALASAHAGRCLHVAASAAPTGSCCLQPSLSAGAHKCTSMHHHLQ